MAGTTATHTPFFTGRIAGWARRHRRWVLIGWVIFAVLTIGSCVGIGANEDLVDSGKGESAEAGELLDARFGGGDDEGGGGETVVFSHPTLTVDDPEYAAVVQGLLSELRDLRGVYAYTTEGETEVVSGIRMFSGTFSHFDIGAPREFSPLVSQNETGGDVTFASASIERIESDDVADVTGAVSRAAEASGFEILIGGSATMGKQIDDMVMEDMGAASMLNLPVTLIILLIALGGLVAAGVPVILAYLGVAMAAGVITLLSYLMPVMEMWLQIVLLMGLAAGIDYALFLFTRFRSEREQGRDAIEAVEIASHTAGKGVFIAATTTVLALLGMFMLGNSIFNAIGLAAVISILVALAVALTLTPALMGDGLSRWNVPRIGPRFNIAQAGLLNPAASWIVRLSAKYPWIVAPLGLALMLLMTYPMLNFNLSFNGASSFHDDIEAKAAILALEDNFTVGLLSPAAVVIDPGEGRNIFASDVQEKVNAFIDLVRAENQRAGAAGEHVPFAEPIDTSINKAGDTEVIEIPLNADTGDNEALDAVKLLREDLVPQVFTDESVRALVTGETAGNVDFKESMNERTLLVVAFVVITAYLVLVVMYRSLVVPLIAVVLNLLAVGAAYGLLVLVFQSGYALEDTLSFEATGIIEFWLPLFVFSVTFGISMDYLTFAIGRVQELYRRGWSTEDAIVEGVGNSFGIVISAAAIMIAVAVVFAFMRFLAIQQMGFTLALAVLFDSSIILLVMLPALMSLLRRVLWYLPGWLNWIPGEPGEDSEPAETQPIATPAGGADGDA